MLKAAARSRYLAWIPVVVIVLAALVWACSGSEGGVDPGEGTTSSSSSTSSSGTSGASSSGTSGASSGTSGATSSGSPDDASTSSSGDGGNAAATIPTEASLKIAFIGDTGTGNDFKKVLQLIKAEQADGVMIQGDLNYSILTLTPAKDWFEVIDAEIPNIPYFISKGNHDVDWGNYGSMLKTKFGTWGITSENNDPTTKNYSVVWKGLKMVFVDDTNSAGDRAAYAQNRLANDAHIWKICSFHKNQRASNVGPKSDEMGWAIYENCRNAGAIVAQGHSHTYSRSKTLTNDTNQVVDTACDQPFDLCVANGKNFFFDSSVGGEDTRSLDTNVSNKPYWGQVFTGNFGALFIEFNVDGDARKAKGYFKTVDNVIVDPPAGSGKTFFTIKRD
jgi:hypothetical protein